LSRVARAPFGEDVDVEEATFNSRVTQLKKFAEDLEKVEVFRAMSEKKTKKVLSD
jgi:uncharacterized protein (DUF488 family)